ncbi:hypothetical protein BDA99DRAFT_123251 [Phascolomyces articulosus]|uniref:PHD-type domain-containing protein n=1 Tax=Phascolomyces articulosus TaxID=60185 RepID=A0AAD5KPI3_9FUNG|nr:hypothetical protein BDA99DRAFT_123251 [Phascolomyces articulosus]
MSTETMGEIEKIRNNIEFASIAQFFHTFQSAFHPWPAVYNPASFLSNQTHLASQAAKRSDDDYVFATEDLESMLIKREERYRLQELMVRMLRLLTRNRFINADTWQNHFAKEIDKREALDPNPFRPEKSEKEDEEDSPQKTEEKQEESIHDDQQPKSSPVPPKALIDFFTFPLLTRLHLLYLLCEWQLDDAATFREHLDNEEEAVHWRVEPIGYDAKGSSYWLFDDNRLYKETPEPKRKRPQKKKSRPRARGTRRSTRRSAQVKEEGEEEEEDVENWMPWKLICLSKMDWEELPKRFENSSNLDEQRLYDMLSNDVLPKVIPVLQEHEDQLKKKELLANRKRSSRIMYKELAAIEHEQQVILEEKAEKTRKSSRREEMERKREEDQKVKIAKAREERLRDRERRLEQREHAQEEAERKKTMVESNGTKPGKKHSSKKRGRKPKNKKTEEEEDWTFDCVCGVSGQNIDDGTPMIACERCGKWQHIECLQKNGHISQDEETLNNSVFFCKPCQEKEAQDVDVDGFEDEHTLQNTALKRTKIEHTHHQSPVAPSQPQMIHPNGCHSPIQTAPMPMVQTWQSQLPPPQSTQPQQQRNMYSQAHTSPYSLSQPPYSQPSHSSPSPPPPQQQRHPQGNPDRFSSPIFPILKPMLPANFSNGNSHHHQQHSVLPPLLPQATNSITSIQSIRPAPPVSLPKSSNQIPQPQQAPSPQIKLQLRPPLQESELHRSYLQQQQQQQQQSPYQQQPHRSLQQQYREANNNNNNNGYSGST